MTIADLRGVRGRVRMIFEHSLDEEPGDRPVDVGRRSHGDQTRWSRGDPSQVDELGEVDRTIGLDRIPEADFVSVVETAVILDSEHLKGGVKPPGVA